jgi:hypothetical protein
MGEVVEPIEAARPQSVHEALTDVARLGPFFAIAVDPAEEADPTWRPFGALWQERDLLNGLVAAYADRLGTGERHVAASILFQGLASRLWSPAVASAAAHGIIPDLASLHWRWAPGAPVALWLAEPARPAGAAPGGTAPAGPCRWPGMGQRRLRPGRGPLRRDGTARAGRPGGRAGRGAARARAVERPW